MKRIILAGVLAAGLAACTSAGTDTGTGTGTGGTGGTLGTLINVNISNIRAEIAKNLNISIENVPVTVQASVEVAADVCGVSVNVLSVQISTGQTSCTATTSSPELEQIVSNQLNA
jgi:hypothetical protein